MTPLWVRRTALGILSSAFPVLESTLSDMDFKLGELFCGPGGLAHGALSARVTATDGEPFTISHAWANDHDKDTCETYCRCICPNSARSAVNESV